MQTLVSAAFYPCTEFSLLDLLHFLLRPRLRFYVDVAAVGEESDSKAEASLATRMVSTGMQTAARLGHQVGSVAGLLGAGMGAEGEGEEGTARLAAASSVRGVGMTTGTQNGLGIEMPGGEKTFVALFLCFLFLPPDLTANLAGVLRWLHTSCLAHAW